MSFTDAGSKKLETPFLAPSYEGLRYLSLELTDFCNLECSHCYAQSGPQRPRRGKLTTEDYKDLLSQAAELGCRAVQFIGGEPTLNDGLAALIEHASLSSFDEIEVYTNGTHLPLSLLDCFVRNSVGVAVSVYADDASIHDIITGKQGSHRKTMLNIARMVNAGVNVRAAFVEMDLNLGRSDATKDALRQIGVNHVRVDRARAIGRGISVSQSQPGFKELCGQCWKGTLSVTPDGLTSACVMSKSWTMGSVLEKTLGEIVSSGELRSFRKKVRTDFYQAPSAPPCAPDDCMPSMICPPSDPGCVPKRA